MMIVKIPSVKKMSQNYLNVKKQILKSYEFISNIKTIFTIILLLFSIWVYGYFVNVSSTKWYFLKKERQELSEIKFQNEIVKIDVRKIEWDILDKILPSSLDSSVPTTWKVIILPNILQIAKK